MWVWEGAANAHPTYSRGAWACVPGHQPWLFLAPVPGSAMSVGDGPPYKTWRWEQERRACGPGERSAEAAAVASHSLVLTCAAPPPDTPRHSQWCHFCSSHIPAPVTSDDTRHCLCCSTFKWSLLASLEPKMCFMPYSSPSSGFSPWNFLASVHLSAASTESQFPVLSHLLSPG